MQLDQSWPKRLGDPRACRVRTGEKHAVNTLFDQRCANLAAAHEHVEHLVGDTSPAQQTPDRKARHCCVLRGLVEHRVAGQQCGNEDVAANEPRVVPRRDIRDQAQRHVLDLLGHAILIEHGLGRRRALDAVEKKIDASQQAIELVAGHPDRFARLCGHDGRQMIKFVHDRSAKSDDALLARGERR